MSNPPKTSYAFICGCGLWINPRPRLFCRWVSGSDTTSTLRLAGQRVGWGVATSAGERESRSAAARTANYNKEVRVSCGPAKIGCG